MDGGRYRKEVVHVQCDTLVCDAVQRKVGLLVYLGRGL
jgi:hypothetical protein